MNIACQESFAQPDHEAERKHQIVQRIIRYFGTQEILASQTEVGVDQSAVSLWLRRGRIPSDRMDQIMAASKRLVSAGKRKCGIEPNDFFDLPATAAAIAWDGVLLESLDE